MIIAIGNIHVLSLYQGIDGAVLCLASVMSREIIMPLCDLRQSSVPDFSEFLFSNL